MKSFFTRAPVSNTSSAVRDFARHTSRHICDAGNAEYANVAVARGQHFGDGGHANQIGAERAKRMNLCRSFVVRPEQREIYALMQIEFQTLALFGDESAEFRVVSVRHVRETRPKAIVIRPDQRIRGLID